MSAKIYIGNLNYATTEAGLASLFSQFGEVLSVAVIKDKLTQRSKGFGFVEMESAESAELVINELNEKEFEGRRLRVNYAEEKPRFPFKN